MSTFFTVDKEGNRIKTNVLTSGYLRQEMENIHKILILSDLKKLCFQYWFMNICDQWDVELCKHKDIAMDEEIVKTEKPVSRNV